jgi:CubicO group peptidase (beta-lactamase class C family)
MALFKLSAKFVSALILLAAVPLVSAQTSPRTGTYTAAELKHQLDASAPLWLKQDDVPSVAVAYISQGKVAWTAVYGEQGPNIPATDKTLYNMASLTKPITAEVILRMTAKGKVSLDESMSPYWLDPDLKGNPWADLLTPRINLSHQTGFANWRRMTDGKLTFRWKPGTQMGYSGEGYNYLVRFASNKSESPFADLAQTYVFDPIGMKDTSYTPRPWFTGRLAQPYGVKGWGQNPQTWDVSGADLVRTTIGDYARFVISVMHDEGLTESLAAERKTITREQVTPEDGTKICAKLPAGSTCKLSVGMGLGWQVDHFNDVTLLEHGGSDEGFHTLAFFEPKTQTGVIVFTNGDNGPKTIAKAVGLLYPNPIYLLTLH